MKVFALATLCLCVFSAASGQPLEHFGDYLLSEHFKIIDGKKVSIPMKPLAFSVYTDGITVRIAPKGETEGHSSFEIYRSDGIARQRRGAGAIEIVPGIQASSFQQGVLKHLRLTQESFTLTSFPGVSNQTIISFAVAAAPTAQPVPEASLSHPSP